ncbi:hypothetical protein [Thermococcus stetteri]|uniref:hypothetical protein n=1 Tax=Thermococcus stetteri TaxID=49900 RepID=UPI001AE789AB|nr:hypothetical protein [Thermococcus stetteri]
MWREDIGKIVAEKVVEVWNELLNSEIVGVPHIVGRISPDGDVELSLVFFEDYTFNRIIDDAAVSFTFPVDARDPKELFVSLLKFIRDGTTPMLLEPGEKIKEPLKENLVRRGFEVLWIAGDSYVDVWVSKNGIRYHLSFERTGKEEYTLIRKERIQ